MPVRDKNKLSIIEQYEGVIRYQFISLNYTTAFDRLLVHAKKAYAPFNTRKISQAAYRDDAGDVLHPHGLIENDLPTEIVFGIAEKEQAANSDFANDERFVEMWVKSEKNREIYANDKTSRLFSLIDGAEIICLYGLSLGESDSYIWQRIGTRYKNYSNFKLVLFVHNMPDRSGINSLDYQKSRDENLNKLMNALGITDLDNRTFRSRVVLIPSKDVFDFDIKLCEGGLSSGE